MADEENKQENEDSKSESNSGESMIKRLLPWIILTVVVIFCAGAGFGLGRLFAGSRTTDATEVDSSADNSNQKEDLSTPVGSEASSNNVWYYDLDPVVASLNEPSVTRYVRASLTLQMSSDLEQKKGTEIIDKKKPVLINWLTVYLSGLTLEDIRGDKNLKAIQWKVCESFNEILFPDSKAYLKEILIKEFPVQ